MGTNEAERLGQLVVARRIQLGLRTSVALAEAAGLTPRVISDLELGRRSNFSASTRAQIEGALKWHTGSIDDALKGREPRPIRGAGLSDLLPPRTELDATSSRPTLGPSEQRELVHEGVDASRRLFATMLAEYLVMSARNTKFLENSDDPVIHESRAELAEMMNKATRNVAIHFLVQLDPAWNMPEVVEAVTSLLAPADRETLESTRQTFVRAYEILSRTSGPPRPSNITPLADHRPAPPPDVDDFGVAASLREKKSDGEHGRSSGWWDTPNGIADPRATPGFVPGPIRAVVPAAVFHEHAEAATSVQKRLNAVRDAFVQQRLTTDIVALALNAINDYGISARSIMAELRRVELDATQEQIDSALSIFEQGWEYVDSVYDFIGEILPMAPDEYGADRIAEAQRSLRELAEFFHHAHDVWVETGRSSRSLKTAARRRDMQRSGRDRDDDDRE